MSENTERKVVTQPPPKGLVCRECGCNHWDVVRTRQYTNRILRVRQCRFCGRQHRASERLEG